MTDTTINTVTRVQRNAELESLVSQLKTQDARRADYVAPATHIEVDSGNVTIATETGDVTVTPTPTMIGTAAQRLSLPVKTLREFHQGHQDPIVSHANMSAFDAMVNARLTAAQANGRSFMVRTFEDPDGGNGIGRALLSDRYRIVDNIDVLTTALAGVQETGTAINVVGCDLTETRMRVRVTAPAVAYVASEFLKSYRNPFSPGLTGYQAGEEPIIFAGFELSNSETGGGSFSIVPRFEIKICRNGMRIVKDAMRQVHLGGRLDEGQVQWADDTQQASLTLVRKMARDAVKTFLSPDYLESAIKALESAAAVPVPGDAVKDVVERLGKSHRWSETESDSVLRYFYAGGQYTAGGVMQGVTAAAQDIVDPERAAEFEAQGVDVLNATAAMVAA